MEFKKIFVLFAVFLAVSGMALAIRGATIDGTFTDLDRWTATTGGGPDTTEGGNITYGNLTGNSLTDRWAGYFGNISGATIYLTDEVGGSNNYLYQWTITGGSESGEVCVSTASAFDFTTATGATAAEVNTGFGLGSYADNATNTFDDGNCANFTFEEQGVVISSAAEADHMSQSAFSTCAVDDGTPGASYDDFAFCTTINTSGQNYNASAAEYELIVPTNFSTATAFTQYYFYIEVA